MRGDQGQQAQARRVGQSLEQGATCLGLGVAAVRSIRDDIRQRVRQLLGELDVTG